MSAFVPRQGFAEDAGAALYAHLRALYPLCRSITGRGLRETLRSIGDHIPLTVTEVASGTPVLDWTVPDEWTIRGAHIETTDGRRLVDFASSNLHVVGYSRPVDAIVQRAELARRIHTLPNQPDLIPYRTGYFADDWGFCLPHRLWAGMTDPAYRVRIDSTLAPGSLSYGEFFVPGTTEHELLISVHCCHPSLANDNLSGIVIATALAAAALGRPRRHGLRVLFVPATIGPITWLARNPQTAMRIVAGLVLTCLGDAGPFHYKRSRQDTAAVDRIVPHVLAEAQLPLTELPFSPTGYDERQYNSPAFDLPVGCFMRSPNGSFPEYHTSADDPSFVSPESLAESLDVLMRILEALDAEAVYERVDGRGEPQLGRRGLYEMIGGRNGTGGISKEALLWVLNLADGQHGLVDMADRARLPLSDIRAAAAIACEAELIVERSA